MDNLDFTLPDEEDDELRKIYDENKLSTDYVPKNIVHIEEKMQSIFEDVFWNIALGKSAERNIFIYGRPGTGKTMMVKSMIRKIKEDNPPEKLANFKILYINCSKDSSESEVLKKIAESVDMEWQKGISNSDNKEELLDHLDGVEKPLLAILDEIDKLKKKRGTDYINDVLEFLSRANEMHDPLNLDSNMDLFSIIAISNDPDTTSYLKDHNDSEIEPKEIPMEKYTVTEIADILQARQEEAFKEELLDYEALEMIAEEVRKTYESDIRKALGMLKLVPKKLNNQPQPPQDNKDQEKAVREAINDYKSNMINRVLKSRDEHDLILLHALVQNLMADKTKFKLINDGYRKGCRTFGVNENKQDDRSSKSKSFVRRTLNDLVAKKVLIKEKNTDERMNPYHYYPNFDKEMFKRKVEDKMVREGLMDKKKHEGKTKAKEEALKESDEYLSNLA